MAAAFPVAREVITGDAGVIEVAAHISPDLPPRAVAIVAHPHPLFGGSMDNKVVTTVARAFFDAGAAVYRFNFRGVGTSEGSHDEGRGEARDMCRVIDHARAAHPGLPLWLAGFSFGGAVAMVASQQIAADELVLIAPSFRRLADWEDPGQGGKPPESTLLIHGELDETVPLAQSLAWALPRDLTVTVVPGAEHFFHQRLHIIKRLIAQHLGARHSAR
jgi:alpha/beta superfamily hydrolase